MVTIY